MSSSSRDDLWRKNINPANRRASSRAPRPSNRRRLRIRPIAPSVLKRSKSEPTLCGVVEQEDDEQGVLYRPRTCTDIFSSSDNLLSHIPAISSQERYNKDTKVVVNVTIERSPGPIRTMLKLGTNIEEMIQVVVNKYNEEGRTPRLDKDAVSSCALHCSSFSLDSLSRSDLIGDVGTRSFYLRKNTSGHSNDSTSEMTPGSSNKDITRATSSNQLTVPAATHFFQVFIKQHIKKIIRKTRKIWGFFGCITCSV